MQSQAPAPDISKSFRTMLGCGPSVPLRNTGIVGGESVHGGNTVVGYGTFLKTHAVKIFVLVCILVVITIFLVRATLVARSKKKQAIKDEKKEEDMQWENYFEESSPLAAGQERPPANAAGVSPARVQLPTPYVSPPLSQEQAAVFQQQQQQAAAFQQQQQQAAAFQQQQQQAAAAFQQQRLLSHPPSQTQAPQNRPPQTHQQPASAQHNRQHQPAMPPADSAHMQHGGSNMLPQSTRAEREPADFTMPVSDVPITTPKLTETENKK